MSRTAEEWGRIAISLPGWRWMPGMSFGYKHDRKGLRVSDSHGPHFRLRCDDGVLQGTTLPGGKVVLVFPTGSVIKGSEPWPDPDDPATAGCMLKLLGEQWGAYHYRPTEHPAHTPYEIVIDGVGDCVTDASTLGRSCIIAAAALGRWPGGDK